MTTRACRQCGDIKRIQGRGLCSRCYTGLRNAGALDRYPADAMRGRPKGMPLARAHVRNVRAETAAALVALRAENRRLKTIIRRIMAALEAEHGA